MTFRRLILGLGIIALAVGTYAAIRLLAPSEVQWRLKILEVKVRGELGEIPLRDLIGWLAPNSPVYLASVAENPDLHYSIRNIRTTSNDAAEGKVLYVRVCGQCHGGGGHGNLGPNLLNSISSKSDWSFFSVAKWGKPGT